MTLYWRVPSKGRIVTTCSFARDINLVHAHYHCAVGSCACCWLSIGTVILLFEFSWFFYLVFMASSSSQSTGSPPSDNSQVGVF